MQAAISTLVGHVIVSKGLSSAPDDVVIVAARIMVKVFYAERTDVFPGLIARNNAFIEYEKFIHRTYYPYIIHPYSKLRVTWEKCCLVFIPIRMLLVSLMWAVLPHDNFFFRMCVVFFEFINFMDLVINFFTGYIEPNTEIAVFEPKKIAKRYLVGCFAFDFLSSIPMGLIYKIMRPCDKNKSYEWCNLVYDLLIHMCYLRYFSFIRYFQKLAKIMLWNLFFVGILLVCLGTFFFLVLANNVYCMMGILVGTHFARWYVDKEALLPSTEVMWGNLKEYVRAFSVLILDCLYFEDEKEENYVYVRIIVLICTFFTNIVFVAFFIKYLTLKMIPKDRFLDLESRVLTFVRIRHLPRILESKTLLYFQLLLENKSYTEDEIFNYIPDTFKAEIFFELCLPLLKHFYAFEDLPTYVLRRLAECMKYQLCLPNEVILKRDETSLSMFFVQRGTVALYSAKHVELYHFEAGSSFNGRNFVLGEPSTGHYAISIEVSEVYQLKEEDFIEIMNMYPGLYKSVQKKVLDDKSGGSYMLR